MIADDTAIPNLNWLRQFAPQTKAPEGQPNEAYEKLTELLMFLEEAEDYKQIKPRIARLRLLVENHNTDVRQRCERRWNEPVPCGGTKAAKCPECPRREGLSVSLRAIT